jgi:alpha-methylacyl-CoA racemase
MSGPLEGLKIVEMAGIGPVPFAGMLLADLGASIVRVDRLRAADVGLPDRIPPRFDVMARGRRSIAVDLKGEPGRRVVQRLVHGADVLMEGYRPGVMERLGLGPEPCLASNPRLVYARMTGYGQSGPMRDAAGHDLNYISLTGALHAIGPADGPPVPPLTLVGDFGGGALLLAVGILAALRVARETGKGQIVDTAMTEGASYLMAPYYGLLAAGHWQDARGANILDGAAPWYRTYATRDKRHVAVSAIEKRFYDALVAGLGLDPATLPEQHDRARWPELAKILAAAFRKRTREEWAAHFAEREACVTPVLTIGEAPHHPHLAARGAFVSPGGVPQPAPHPRFSTTPTAAPGSPPVRTGANTRAVLAEHGFSPAEIAALIAAGTCGE